MSLERQMLPALQVPAWWERPERQQEWLASQEPWAGVTASEPAPKPWKEHRGRPPSIQNAT